MLGDFRDRTVLMWRRHYRKTPLLELTLRTATRHLSVVRKEGSSYWAQDRMLLFRREHRITWPYPTNRRKKKKHRDSI